MALYRPTEGFSNAFSEIVNLTWLSEWVAIHAKS